MITEKFFELSTKFLELIFGIIPKVPNLPSSLHDKLFDFIDIIFTSSESILSLFVRIETVKITVPILLVIINFDKIYKVFMWLLKKIPFLSMN